MPQRMVQLHHRGWGTQSRARCLADILYFESAERAWRPSARQLIDRQSRWPQSITRRRYPAATAKPLACNGGLLVADRKTDSPPLLPILS